MSAENISRLRQQVAHGVGKTTRKNKSLPFSAEASSIPDRIGTAGPDGKKKAPAFDHSRGFVAVFLSALGRRFDPYDLTIKAAFYELAGAQYAVQGFATAYNVSDLTNWRDTICLFADKIYINGIPMDALQMPVAILSAPAIPFFISDVGFYAPYGSAAGNATNKRVFAVGRYHAQSWGGGGVTATLPPSTPRDDHKAMTIGQRTIPATDQAWLGQIYYTGSTWDDVGGSWAFSDSQIQMLLAAPYLSQTNSSPSVDMTVAALPTSGTGSSGTINTALTLPATAVGLVGIGELNIAANVYSVLTARIYWPARRTFDYALDGTVVASYTRTTFASSQSASTVQAGRTLSYSETNSKYFDSRSEYTKVNGQNVPTGSSASYWTNSEDQISNVSNTLVWSDGGNVASKRGNIYFTAASETISGTSVTKTYESQTITASVSLSGDLLVSVSATINKSAGQPVNLTPNASFYNTYLSNPYVYVNSSSGYGIYQHVLLTAPYGLGYYKNPSGYFPSMPAYAVAEIQASYDAKQAQMVGTECYDYEGNSGTYHTGKYTASLGSSVSTIAAALSWTTKDYLLYDATNATYISITGSLIGSQVAAGAASAVLTVALKVETPHNTHYQVLYNTTFSYSTLLNETQIGTTGKYAVPSPKVRAIFAPLYQEQGSFKGAAYVTAAEESAGATPASLFNFALQLKMHDGFSTLNADNMTGERVNFVPLNLLEMLYAQVFDQGLGVGSQRYTVSSSSRFSAVQAALFTNPIAVNIRNGTAGSWAGALGGDTAGLFRT